ncbi:MAG TPA: aspartate-semialdehyde dehydrogenase [Longimicrobiales bacterium]|nr:aspartate-semialdehyde dehydrogenase [Longimicrobiales bacterium]
MKVAVLGATGAVGRTMLRILEERGFPVDELVPLASARSAGTGLHWRGRDWTVAEPSARAFQGCDVALFSAGSGRSTEWAPVAADAGAVVIDNSSAWRMHPQVPLVVPEVNAEAAADRPLGIIANPNCATIQLVVALHALHRARPLRRVVVTTLQSVSGAGHRGVAALAAELAGGTAADSPFASRIAGNVIPSIGPRQEDGWNEEEAKIRAETRKILGLPGLPVAATCVRVPVETGHSISAMVETETPLDVPAAEAALAAAGVAVGGWDADPLPCDVAGSDDVRVGRIRVDPDLPGVLHLWIVADNLRKGAATNAVQIAEALLHGAQLPASATHG